MHIACAAKVVGPHLANLTSFCQQCLQATVTIGTQGGLPNKFQRQAGYRSRPKGEVAECSVRTWGMVAWWAARAQW